MQDISGLVEALENKLSVGGRDPKAMGMKKGKVVKADARPSCMETQGRTCPSGHAGLFPEVTSRAVIGLREIDWGNESAAGQGQRGLLS